MGGVSELLDGRVVATEHSAEGLGQRVTQSEKSERLPNRVSPIVSAEGSSLGCSVIEGHDTAVQMYETSETETDTFSSLPSWISYLVIKSSVPGVQCRNETSSTKSSRHPRFRHISPNRLLT